MMPNSPSPKPDRLNRLSACRPIIGEFIAAISIFAVPFILTWLHLAITGNAITL